MRRPRAPGSSTLARYPPPPRMRTVAGSTQQKLPDREKREQMEAECPSISIAETPRAQSSGHHPSAEIKRTPFMPYCPTKPFDKYRAYIALMPLEVPAPAPRVMAFLTTA